MENTEVCFKLVEDSSDRWQNFCSLEIYFCPSLLAAIAYWDVRLGPSCNGRYDSPPNWSVVYKIRRTFSSSGPSPIYLVEGFVDQKELPVFDSCFQQSGTTTRVAKRAPSCQSGPLQNTFWCLLVLVLSILVSWNSAAAQDGKKESVPKKIKPDTSAKQIKAKGQQLINQAYQLTTTAQEPEEFERIIKLCKHALMEELPKRHQEYTKRLLSWAHN